MRSRRVWREQEDAPEPEQLQQREAAPERGFTLLELIAVMTILAVLSGIGIGFLQRGSTDLDLARSLLRDQIRRAHTTARARSLPTEVLVIAPTNQSPARVQARVLAPVGQWHCEPGERWASQIQPVLAGTDEPAGRFGHALRHDAKQRRALLDVATGTKSYFDLANGFAFRIELQLDQRVPMTVARLGRAFTLGLDGELVPELKVTLADVGARAGVTIPLRGARPLVLGEWTTLEVVQDGRVVRLYVDGREVGSADARGRVLQESRDHLEISLPDAPVLGLVDEVQLLAYELDEAKDLPGNAHLADLQIPIAFDRRGDLVEPVRFTLVVGEQREKLTIAPGGVLQ